MGVLCNSGLRQRHWEAMSEIIGDNITPDSGTTLRKMLKNDITPCFEQFETISTGASKVREEDFFNARFKTTEYFFFKAAINWGVF